MGQAVGRIGAGKKSKLCIKKWIWETLMNSKDKKWETIITYWVRNLWCDSRNFLRNFSRNKIFSTMEFQAWRPIFFQQNFHPSCCFVSVYNQSTVPTIYLFVNKYRRSLIIRMTASKKSSLIIEVGISSFTLDEFEEKKVSVYFSKSKHSQHNFAAPRS